ncbi:amino acid adenylation domain-containing protein [Kitasatospora purpeofusca]|uniref:amino acid adenylation domain-containing protein n=1 Tax=Kitasatospora purpeofusca TaxID=67352 RepID=UPI00324A5D20
MDQAASVPESAARTSPSGLRRLPLAVGAAELAADRALKGAQPSEQVEAKGGVWARVSERAAEHPHRTAVRSDSQMLTYRQLCHRVRQIRATLVVEGCRKGDRIAVAGRRSADTIAVFLAIESLGAIYLPIATEWPELRLTDVLRHARPRCLFTHDATGAAGTSLARAAADAEVPVLTAPEATTDAPPFVEPKIVPDDEARYVIHTSGTTGRPKGAVVNQLGLMNHLWSMVAALRLTAADTVAFTAPPAYVISVWQMLAVLLVGGSVAVVPDADLRFARHLVARVSGWGVTVLELVPTVIGWIMRDTGIARGTPATRNDSGLTLPDLRCLISTGERLDPALASEVLRTLPQADLFNAYGSTECSDDVALHHVRPTEPKAPQLPVGAPLPGVALYLLVREGEWWRAAEPGEAGELWVGGRAVGAGYLDAPERTERSFFADEFDPQSLTGRIYRTGDTAFFADGLAYCIGRADRQVKVAGVRIELDEVEAAVAVIPGVLECAIVARINADKTELVVHYVAEPSTSQNDLVTSLRSSLPSAMLPHRWIRRATLPLSGHGKVDYRALR